jgi:hypothetical protein
LGNSRLFWLCTDQSGFDLNQRREWVVYTIRKLYEHLSTVQDQADYFAVLERELASLEQVYLHYDERVGGEIHKRKLKWENGVLSGYSLTALVDTVLNAAATKVVLDTLGLVPKVQFYQGDDCIVGLEREVAVAEVARLYGELLGLEVNPEKTWASWHRCEYLHEIYAQGTVYGFPARAMRVLIWRKPSFGSVVNSISKFESVKSACLMGLRRGLVGMDVVLRSLMRSLNLHWDEKKFLAWYRTPVCFDGFGAGRDGRVGLKSRSDF